MPVTDTGTGYELSGPEDAPVVVLIHGVGLDRRSVWAPVARWLAGRFRVLNYDLPGHGESAPAEGDLSLTMLANHLIDLLNYLSISRAALVGFSIGGMINRRVAMDHPERVSALVILNAPHQRDAEMQAQVTAQARARMTRPRMTGEDATIQATLERWFTPDYRRENKALVEEVRAVVMAVHPESFATHHIVLAEGVSELIHPEPPITHPTLVMTCENDVRSTPAMSRAIADEITGAEIEVIPELQHLGLVERPMMFASRIETYLERVLT